MNNPTCPYCGQVSELVGGDVIYPHRPDLSKKLFYRCEPCDARVGVHAGTLKPLGRLANAELRSWKMKAHSAFDPIWLSKRMKRKQAYIWLSKELGINVHNCHIGMFDIDTCKQVVEVCS